jgi:hypothetical protein
MCRRLFAHWLGRRSTGLDELELRRRIDRRGAIRVADGVRTELVMSDGTSFGGRILDVSSNGARLWSSRRLAIGSRISCRVEFVKRCFYPGLRIAWERPSAHGYEYGVAYRPVVPGTERVLEDYSYLVGHRTQQKQARARLHSVAA